METRSDSDVPGAAGQRASTETAPVIHKINNNHFDDLEGEPGSGRRVRHGGLRRNDPLSAFSGLRLGFNTKFAWRAAQSLEH